MNGCASASCFAITGSSTSSGNRPRTRDTRSRTSCAASSTSRSSVNSSVMLLDCSADELVSVRSPGTVDSSSSMGSVTADSTVWGLAPGRMVLTEMIGGSTSGYSRTESWV